MVSCANLYFKHGFNIFVKGAYEQNKSNEVIPDYGIGGLFDCFGEAGHTYCTYGIGAEYRPDACPDFRLHAFLANRTTTYSEEEEWHGHIDYNNVKENSLRFNIGITWDMDIHRMLKDRIAKTLSERSTLE